MRTNNSDSSHTLPILQGGPTLSEEMTLFSQGHYYIAGLDEAGRGCLAGPVVAAAVMLPLEADSSHLYVQLKGVNDSKQLSASTRERLYDVIHQHALAIGVGVGSVELIDERNILQATKQAMRDAISSLSPSPRRPTPQRHRTPTTLHHQR